MAEVPRRDAGQRSLPEAAPQLAAGAADSPAPLSDLRLGAPVLRRKCRRRTAAGGDPRRLGLDAEHRRIPFALRAGAEPSARTGRQPARHRSNGRAPGGRTYRGETVANEQQERPAQGTATLRCDRRADAPGRSAEAGATAGQRPNRRRNPPVQRRGGAGSDPVRTRRIECRLPPARGPRRECRHCGIGRARAPGGAGTARAVRQHRQCLDQPRPSRTPTLVRRSVDRNASARPPPARDARRSLFGDPNQRRRVHRPPHSRRRPGGGQPSVPDQPAARSDPGAPRDPRQPVPRTSPRRNAPGATDCDDRPSRDRRTRST